MRKLCSGCRRKLPEGAFVGRDRRGRVRTLRTCSQCRGCKVAERSVEAKPRRIPKTLEGVRTRVSSLRSFILKDFPTRAEGLAFLARCDAIAADVRGQA